MKLFIICSIRIVLSHQVKASLKNLNPILIPSTPTLSSLKNNHRINPENKNIIAASTLKTKISSGPVFVKLPSIAFPKSLATCPLCRHFCVTASSNRTSRPRWRPSARPRRRWRTFRFFVSRFAVFRFAVFRWRIFK